ncbi:MAG: DUF481 domain-containing protein [Bacteroidota bacterium]
MNHRPFPIFLLLLFTLAHAQIVNTEKLRLNAEKKTYYIDGDFALGLTSNQAGQSGNYSLRFQSEWEKNKHRLLGFAGGSQTRFVGRSEGALPQNFVNNRFAHLRYNYELSSSLTAEVFSQIQFNEIQLIRNRLLNGLGTRFRLLDSDTSSLFLGGIVMFEYEEEFKKSTDPAPSKIDTINRDVRFSGYLSTSYAFTNYFSIDHVTYYQPIIHNFSDFRINSETILNVNLTTNLSFKTFFQFIYDSRPPDPAVPNIMYRLTTGLGFSL